MAKLFGRFDRAASAAASIGASRPESSSGGSGRGGRPDAPAAAAPEPDSPRKPRSTVSDVDTREVPLSLIVPDPDNDRGEITPDSVADLVASFRARGQLTSALVYQLPGDDRFYLIFGHRRRFAAEQAGWETLRCDVFDGKPSEGQIAAYQMIENEVREDLPPLKRAASYARTMQLNGWSQAQLVKETGANQGKVSKFLSLLELAPHVRDLIDRGELEWSRAYELRKLKDPGQQAEVADLAVVGEWTGAQVKAAVERRLGGFTGPLPGQAPLPIAADPPPAQAGPIAEEPAHVTETPYSAGMESAPAEAPEADAWTPPPDPPTPAQELRREIRKARESIATAGETPGGYQVATGVRIVKPEGEPEPHPIDRHLDRVDRVAEEGALAEPERLAGWFDPQVWGDITNFVFEEEEGEGALDAVVTIEARTPSDWAATAELLGRARHAALWRAQLAAVEGGPARPGDLVEAIDPAHACAGVIGRIEPEVSMTLTVKFEIGRVGVVSERWTFFGAELRRVGPTGGEGGGD